MLVCLHIESQPKMQLCGHFCSKKNLANVFYALLCCPCFIMEIVKKLYTSFTVQGAVITSLYLLSLSLQLDIRRKVTLLL